MSKQINVMQEKSVQVIVAAMHQEDDSLIDKMNLRSDALICNQGSTDGKRIFKRNNNTIVYIDSTQRGVGRNRNAGISNSSGDILLFADEDVRYHDEYVSMIRKEYEKYPDADAIVFNLNLMNSERPESRDCAPRRVRWHSSLRYGTFRFSIKRRALIKVNVWFSLLFGGGAEFGFGEDSLFLSDCIKRGLKVYASEVEIGDVDQSTSTWFEGYNNTYFRDKGVLYRAISKRMYYLLAAHYLIKHGKEFSGLSRLKVLRLMNEGKRMHDNYSNI